MERGKSGSYILNDIIDDVVPDEHFGFQSPKSGSYILNYSSGGS